MWLCIILCSSLTHSICHSIWTLNRTPFRVDVTVVVGDANLRNTPRVSEPWPMVCLSCPCGAEVGVSCTGVIYQVLFVSIAHCPSAHPPSSHPHLCLATLHTTLPHTTLHTTLHTLHHTAHCLTSHCTHHTAHTTLHTLHTHTLHTTLHTAHGLISY